LRIYLSIALAPFDLQPGRALTITSRLQLTDKPRLFELREHAGDLPHRHLERIVRLGEVVA
jgi:hypothetical protein